jgi:hypothetical protein
LHSSRVQLVGEVQAAGIAADEVDHLALAHDLDPGNLGGLHRGRRQIAGNIGAEDAVTRLPQRDVLQLAIELVILADVGLAR